MCMFLYELPKGHFKFTDNHSFHLTALKHPIDLGLACCLNYACVWWWLSLYCYSTVTLCPVSVSPEGRGESLCVQKCACIKCTSAFPSARLVHHQSHSSYLPDEEFFLWLHLGIVDVLICPLSMKWLSTNTTLWLPNVHTVTHVSASKVFQSLLLLGVQQLWDDLIPLGLAWQVFLVSID